MNWRTGTQAAGTPENPCILDKPPGAFSLNVFNSKQRSKEVLALLQVWLKPLDFSKSPFGAISTGP